MEKAKINLSFLFSDPRHLLACGFGSGAAPFAPGTFGTLVGILLYLGLQGLPLLSYLLVILVSFVLGIHLCERAADELGVHDHSGIVWDEIVGYWITMIAAPPGWIWLLAGFVLFRIFDIAKPWPIGWLDRQVKGGLGVMLDDVLAAGYACLGLHLIYYLYAA